MDLFAHPAAARERREAIADYVRVFGSVSVLKVATLLRVTPERAREDLRSLGSRPGITVQRGRVVACRQMT